MLFSRWLIGLRQLHSDNPAVDGVRLLAGGHGVDSRRFAELCVVDAASVGGFDSIATIGMYQRDGRGGLSPFYADPVGEILGNGKWSNVIVSNFGTFTTAYRRNSRSRTRSVCT